MIYIEPPNEFAPWEYPRLTYSLFLAGGITNCPDWQSAMVSSLKDENLILLNPRRKNFLMDDPNAAQSQIEWESRHMVRASAILFWFCAATLCPIALYELGLYTTVQKPIFIGIQPGYAREKDVIIQTRMKRPEIKIVSKFDDLIGQVKYWVKET